MSIVSEELDFKSLSISHGTYQLSKVTPQSGLSTVNITTSGGQESIFEFSPRVYNLGRSILSFTATPNASGASQYNWFHCDGLSMIRQIQLYTRTGVYMVDIQDLNKYMKMTMRMSHKIKDVITWDKADDADGYFEGLRCNNTDEVQITASALGGRPTTAGLANTSMLEPSYTFVGAVNTATPVINFQVPFSRIVDSIIGLDRDQLFGETIYLRIVWAPSTQAVFFGTSATNPTTGATVFAGELVLSNLLVYLAVEQNPIIIQEMQNKYNAGLSYMVPYVYHNKQNLSSTSQNISLKYNRAHGMKLKKILWSPFNNTESVNTTYDNDNLADDKVLSYYTLVNNVRTSQFNYNTSAGEDWLDKKHLFKDSCILGSNEYYYNFVHVEDFTDGKGLDANIDDGLDLTTEIKWDMSATTADAQHNHYIYAIATKQLTVSPAGVTLI